MTEPRNYYHIFSFSAYCMACGELILNQGHSLMLQEPMPIYHEKRYLKESGKFHCPSCGQVDTSLYIKAVTSDNDYIKSQFILHLRKIDRQISWMPIENDANEINESIEWINDYIDKLEGDSADSPNGKAIVVVDFFNNGLEPMVSTYYTDGVTNENIRGALNYIKDRL